jgi:hypothetical protein
MTIRGLILLSVLLCALPALAADRCAAGRGEVRATVGAHSVEIAPSDAEGGLICRAVVRDDSGVAIFDTTAQQLSVELVSGRDVNQDQSPDIVLSAIDGDGKFRAIVVSLAAPPVVRQIATSSPLTFADRDGDEKVEITGYEWAFLGFDGLGESESPQPMAVFRMKGSSLINISQMFWPEYESEIARTEAVLTQKEKDDFLEEEVHGKEPKKPTEREATLPQIRRTKGAVLSIILNYLYGGRGQQAWETVGKLWPGIDRQRARQLILKARASGLMSEVNRQTPQAAATAE